MSRILQLIKGEAVWRGRRTGTSFSSIRSLKRKNSPQHKAVCMKVLTLSPKKPNSANRRVARVKVIQDSCFLTVKIPGEKHTLQQHSTVLINGAKCRDLIGVQHKAIRGKHDLLGVSNRSTSRSVYGVKKSK